MARKSAFVKVSGDLCMHPEFIGAIAHLSRTYFVVVCVGGGTQINEALEKFGIPQGQHGPLGRELKSFEERQIARDVLEVNQARLQDEFARQGIVATVVIPVEDIGTVLCHVNGDLYVKTAYLGFDALFVVTTHERRKAKEKQFEGLPKVTVLSFDTPASTSG